MNTEKVIVITSTQSHKGKRFMKSWILWKFRLWLGIPNYQTPLSITMFAWHISCNTPHFLPYSKQIPCAKVTSEASLKASMKSSKHSKLLELVKARIESGSGESYRRIETPRPHQQTSTYQLILMPALFQATRLPAMWLLWPQEKHLQKLQ